MAAKEVCVFLQFNIWLIPLVNNESGYHRYKIAQDQQEKTTLLPQLPNRNRSICQQVCQIFSASVLAWSSGTFIGEILQHVYIYIGCRQTDGFIELMNFAILKPKVIKSQFLGYTNLPIGTLQALYSYTILEHYQQSTVKYYTQTMPYRCETHTPLIRSRQCINPQEVQAYSLRPLMLLGVNIIANYDLISTATVYHFRV